MTPKIELTGQVFGYLTVVGLAPHMKGKEARWLCRCSCGKEISVSGSHLRYGTKRACNIDGHRFTDETIRIKTAHKLHKIEYRCWAQMLSRCRNSKIPSYKYYGGRGIKVCDRWLKFKNFFADMGPKPSTASSIDRIDSNGNYTPENCRWATKKEQSRNRRNKVFVEVKGQIRHLAEVAEEVGIPNSVLNNRIKAQNWPVDKAISAPVKNGNNKKMSDNNKCPKCGKLIALVGHRHLCA